MRQMQDLIDGILSAARTASPFAVGKVATVGAGTPPDVTVDWNGSTVPAKCPRNYTPVVGHVVLMARFGPQLLILTAY